MICRYVPICIYQNIIMWSSRRNLSFNKMFPKSVALLLQLNCLFLTFGFFLNSVKFVVDGQFICCAHIGVAAPHSLTWWCCHHQQHSTAQWRWWRWYLCGMQMNQNVKHACTCLMVINCIQVKSKDFLLISTSDFKCWSRFHIRFGEKKNMFSLSLRRKKEKSWFIFFKFVCF